MPSEAKLENFMTWVGWKIDCVTGNTLFQSNVSVNVFKMEI